MQTNIRLRLCVIQQCLIVVLQIGKRIQLIMWLISRVICEQICFPFFPVFAVVILFTHETRISPSAD